MEFRGVGYFGGFRLDKALFDRLFTGAGPASAILPSQEKASVMELGCSTILYGGHDLNVAMERIRTNG